MPEPQPRRASSGSGLRLLEWLASGLLVLVLGVTVGLPAWTDAAGAPSISVSPSSALPGTRTTVVVANFPAGKVQLLWDGSSTGMPVAQANGKGAFKAEFAVPLAAAAGSHMVGAVSLDGNSGAKGPKAASAGAVTVQAQTGFVVLAAVAAVTPSPQPTARTSPSPTANPSSTVAPTAMPIATATRSPAPTATPPPAPTLVLVPTPTAAPSPTPTAAPATAKPGTPIPSTIAADCSVDVTTPILKWIASVPNNSTLLFGNSACYRIDGTLEVTDRTGLTFEGNGSTFNGSFVIGGGTRAHWRLMGGTGFVLRNMTIRGSNPDTSCTTHTPSLQHQNAIELLGADNVEIYSVTMTHNYGDGVTIGQDWRNRNWSDVVRIHDNTITCPGRNAVSFIAARDVRAERNTTSQVGFITFDVEPNGTGDGAYGITISGNTVGTYYLYFFAITGYDVADYITVTGNRLVGAGMKVWVNPFDVGLRYSSVAVTNNASGTGVYAPNGEAMYFNRVDGLTVTGNIAPLSGSNMALARVEQTCLVNVSGNSYPGGVTELRLSAWTCP